MQNYSGEPSPGRPVDDGEAGEYGRGEIFGPAENFERFRVSKLLASKADLFHKEKRLFLYGYGNFRARTRASPQPDESLENRP
jgi:hypothetical protein